MPEYLAPGVYVEEIEIGSKPIEGVGTSTVGFFGLAERGPGEPTLVTGFEQYRRLYGGACDNSFLPDAVEGFFTNGGTRCVIARVTARDATTARATLTFAQGANPQGAPSGFAIEAASPGAWGNRVGVRVVAGSLATRDKPDAFRMTVFYWREDPPAPAGKAIDPLDTSKVRDPN